MYPSHAQLHMAPLCSKVHMMHAHVYCLHTLSLIAALPALNHLLWPVHGDTRPAGAFRPFALISYCARSFTVCTCGVAELVREEC